MDLECYQYHVITAFLNAPIKGDAIHVQQPTGFSDGTRRVCRLLKALYGLRKSPLWWFEALPEKLKPHGFHPLTSEMCLFRHENGSFLDPPVCGWSTRGCQKYDGNRCFSWYSTNLPRVKRNLAGQGVSRYLGGPKQSYHSRTIYLHQKPYATRILEKEVWVCRSLHCIDSMEPYHIRMNCLQANGRRWKKAPSCSLKVLDRSIICHVGLAAYAYNLISRYSTAGHVILLALVLWYILGIKKANVVKFNRYVSKVSIVVCWVEYYYVSFSLAVLTRTGIIRVCGHENVHVHAYSSTGWQLR